MRYRVLRELKKAGEVLRAGAVVADPRWCNLPSLLAQKIVAREAAASVAPAAPGHALPAHAAPSAHKDTKGKKKEPGA